MQFTVAYDAEESLQLIDGDHRRGWVVDRRRKCLYGNINDDPKSECRILLDRALRTKCDLGAQEAITEFPSIAKEPEQRLALGDIVTNPRYKFDGATQLLRSPYKRPYS